jgi:hypothetical protein
MKAQNLLALTASVLLTAAGVATFNNNVTIQPVHEINGSKVVDLAPVNVTPSAAERRAAALLADDSVAGVGAAALGRGMEASAGLLSTQLAMPYYSFGTQFGRITKE